MQVRVRIPDSRSHVVVVRDQIYSIVIEDLGSGGPLAEIYLTAHPLRGGEAILLAGPYASAEDAHQALIHGVEVDRKLSPAARMWSALLESLTLNGFVESDVADVEDYPDFRFLQAAG